MKRGRAACSIWLSAATLISSVIMACAIFGVILAPAAADDDQLPVAHQSVQVTCDPRGMIPQGSIFWNNLGTLLGLLVENTPYTPSFYFKTRFGGRQAPAFGEAHCLNSSSSSPYTCFCCLQQLSYDIWRICNSAPGAHVEYPECGIHYERYFFY